MLRQLLSVLLVFLLLGAALWALRRFSVVPFRTGRWRRQPARARSLQSLERLSLSPQHSLHLVQIDGRRLVVATHPHGCTLLIESAKGAGA